MVCGSKNKDFAPVPTDDAPLKKTPQKKRPKKKRPKKNAPKKTPPKIGSDMPLAYYECELTNRQIPQFDCKGTVLLQSNCI